MKLTLAALLTIFSVCSGSPKPGFKLIELDKSVEEPATGEGMENSQG